MEQIMAALDAALVAAGHSSTLLAARGSHAVGRLVAVDVGQGELSGERLHGARQRYRQALEALLAQQHFDLLHFHGCDCARYLSASPPGRAVPKLVTLHVPCDWYEPGMFESDLGVRFSCVSEWQREQLATRLSLCATIPNGVDLTRWRPLGQPPSDYVLCLGRISPEKGFDRALRAARRAGVPLLLAGRVFPYPEHLRYFAEQIAPLLDEQRRFLGPIAGTAKRRILARARALLVVSRVPETSSLAAMEALACGTPVLVASPGAPASLIEPGVTGLIVRDEIELAEAFERLSSLDRARCRASAEQRFDLRQTTRRYLELYAQLLTAPPRSHAAFARELSA
ncbi:MAG TPA: glycosyltransferase [Polyangiaceae bacterium]|nr:glycosyltransferase [Polyangiaceae bacterium]